MVRECRPPAREPARSWLARRSTMATSTPANANSPANISPVGPPPAITTACSVIATLRSAPAAVDTASSSRSPAARTPLRAECPQLHRESHHRFDVPARPIRRQQHTHFGRRERRRERRHGHDVRRRAARALGGALLNHLTLITPTDETAPPPAASTARSEPTPPRLVLLNASPTRDSRDH